MKLEIKKIITYSIAAVLIAFGMLTLFLSSSVIFDLFGIRAKEGDYVLFVVWANFFSSLLYLATAFGLIKNKKFPLKLLSVCVIVLIAAFIGLFFHINAGGLYETKTIGAMIFRITVSIVLAVLVYFTQNKK